MKKVIVKTTEELKELIIKTIREKGLECDLSFINTSLITDMSYLFCSSEFNGNISKWNTSNVKNMRFMFSFSKFNGNISKWNIKKVTDMSCMFMGSEFNEDISNWDVSNVRDMSWMFTESKFNQDIGKWNTENVRDMSFMFEYSEFDQDIECWNTGKVKNMQCMFIFSRFNKNISMWNVKNVNLFSRFGLCNEMYLPNKFRNPLDQDRSYIGWMKLSKNKICKLLISESAIKLAGTTSRCRTNRAKVLEIKDIFGISYKTGVSAFLRTVKYEVGKEVVSVNFDMNRWIEGGDGIQFYLDRNDAVECLF